MSTFSSTMTIPDMTSSLPEHTAMIAPSPWVERHLSFLAPGGRVLDLACGNGRHARLLAARGYEVVAVDRDFAAISGLRGVAGITALQLDLEGSDWPLAGERFAGIVVTNYLWRPRLADVCAMLAGGGVLIYETFMLGNEAYGKPSNPEFLLRPGELRAVARAAGLREIAFEEGYADQPKPALRQAICAVRE
jgi:SAM-dependent methyltransferase